MTLIVETGTGIRDANAYTNAAFVTSYLTARNRETENSWSTVSDAVKEAAIIDATDYIDKRFGSRFIGIPKVTFTEVSATGALTFSGLPADSETFVLGDETWTFVSALTGENDFEILIGSTASITGDNVEAALNGASGAGTVYASGGSESRHATALNSGGVVALTALAAGVGGSLTTLTGSVTNMSITAFSGGVEGGMQNLCWPRKYAYDKLGNLIEGIPNSLRQAVAEYAVRSLSAELLPDPTVDEYAGPVSVRSSKIGPIEESVEYSGASGKTLFKPYPSADKLLRNLIKHSGGVTRG